MMATSVIKKALTESAPVTAASYGDSVHAYRYGNVVQVMCTTKAVPTGQWCIVANGLIPPVRAVYSIISDTSAVTFGFAQINELGNVSIYQNSGSNQYYQFTLIYLTAN